MKHKHYNEIIAWAEGKEIEYYSKALVKWEIVGGDPFWCRETDYRVKPEKLVFYVNTYTDGSLSDHFIEGAEAIASANHINQIDRTAVKMIEA